MSIHFSPARATRRENVLNNGQTILAQLYIYIYKNSRTAPIKLPLIAHGHVALIYYLPSKGIVGTSNMLILRRFLDVTSLGCLCPKPEYKYMYVCMSVYHSICLDFKNGLRNQGSFVPEREQTNTHYTNNV